MRQAMWALGALVTIGACGPSEEKQIEQGRELKSEYLEAMCRLYVEEACIEQSSEECGFSIEFDSVSDCRAFFSLFASCDNEALGLALYEIESDVDACIAQLDAFECGGSEPLCTDEGDASPAVTGPCAEVSAAYDAHCEEEQDSGF